MGNKIMKIKKIVDSIMSFLAALTRTVQKSSLFLSCFFFVLVTFHIKFPTYIMMHISIVMIGLAVHFQYVSDSYQPRNCLKMEMKS